MDLELLRSKVQASHLLTDDERIYWLQNLSRMTRAQLEKLASILSKAETIPWGEKAKKYLTIILNKPALQAI